MSDTTCTIDGCDKPARSASADWCKMHYHRWYRHGSTDKVATKSGITASNGRLYRSRYAPTHPLASRNGKVYEHRQVLFDAIGYGPHECHWCKVAVDWLPRGAEGELQPDHINGRGDDNRLENLVPSCRACNTGRAAQHRSAALKDAGWWSHNDTIAGLKRGGRRPSVETRGATSTSAPPVSLPAY